MKNLREALHRCVDILCDAAEADREDAPEQAPVAKPVRASRRGSALRMFVPDGPISPEALERAAAIARRKGF